MTLVRPLTRSVSSALVLSLLGATVTQTLEQQVDEILETEAVSGDAVAQYNQQDLTSMFVETDGSGGNPSVGDSVGFIADTARFEGKTFDQFVSGQTDELGGAGAFDSATGWTLGTDWSISGGTASHASGSAGNLSYPVSVPNNEYALVTFDVVGGSFGGFTIAINGGATTTFGNSVGSRSFIIQAGSSGSDVTIGAGSADGEIDNLVVKHIPGYHLIAASDAARPVLLDSFDQSGAALTDNGGRGENVLGDVDSVSSGWTDNGDGSYTASGVTSFADISFIPDIELGAEYEIELTVSSFTSGQLTVRWGTTNISGLDTIGATGTYSAKFRPDATGDLLRFRGNPALTATITSISVRKVLSAFDERGGELVDVANFVNRDGNGTVTINSSGVTVDNSSGSTVFIQGDYTTVIGVTYEYTFTVTGDEITLRYDGNASNTDNFAAGTHTAKFKATATGLPTWLWSNGESGTLTNISVKQVIYPNLVTNGTFDTDTDWTKGTGWTISGGQADFDGSTAFSQISQSISGAPSEGVWCQLRFYLVSKGSNVSQIRIIVAGAFDQQVNVSGGAGWYSVFYRRGSNESVGIQSGGSATGANDAFSIDHVSVQEVPSSIERIYFLSTDGSDDQIEADIPPATRNLLSYTEDFSNAVWGKSSASMSGGIVTASGTSTSDVRQDIVRATNGETVTLAIDVRRISGSGSYFIQIEEWNGGSYLSGSASSELSLTSEFQRFSITRTGNQASGDRWRIVVRRSAGGGSADGDQIEIRYPQLELGSTATDYQHVAQSGIMPETTIVMAVRTSDNPGMLLNGQTTGQYLLPFSIGSGTPNYGANVGTPTLRKNGSAWTPADWNAIHDDLSNNTWFVISASGVDLSTWTKIVLGFFSTSSGWNTAMDIAYGPVILPDPSAEDLATIEQAAAAACGVTLA